MINQVILVGRLTNDIELKGNEKKVGNFTIAIQRKYKDNEGNYPTDFIDCVIFGKQAETMAQYTKKGDLIGVEGSIQKRCYENKEGKKVYVTEVIASNIDFISQGKKKEENEFKEMSTKTEVKQQIEITEEDLPW